MENERYPYWPLTHRPRIEWPNGAKLAFWVIPNIEHFRFDQPTSPHIPRNPFPDVPNYASRDYGNRVGVWRLMELLDKHGMRATVALNAEVCLHYPQIIKAGVERKWEWMGHGMTNSIRLVGMDEGQERDTIQRVVRIIRENTGQQPKGWLGPGLSETANTPDLLAEAGIEYLADWCADDLPFPMRVRSGRLISVPYSQELNDVPAYLDKHMTAEEFCNAIRDQFESLYAESERGGRVMALALHPYISGHPYRAKWLDKALGYVAGHKDVWLTTGGEIADWYYRNYYDQAPR